jgi:putative ABC transport system permease protein
MPKMMFLSLVKIAIKSLSSNKTRTMLTVLGIMIGIASVIIVYSAGAGLSGLILDEIEGFGSDIIQTEIKVPSSKKGAASEQQSASALVQGVQVTTLSLDDMEDINRLPNVKYGYGALMGQELLSYGNSAKKAFILGVNSHYIDIDMAAVEFGDFFSESDNNSLAKVVVLGHDMKKELFGEDEAIGKLVKIKQSKYLVVGVMEERGASLALNWDDMVYMPIKTLQKRLMGVNHLTYMVHKMEDVSLADETAEEMREILRENHDLPKPQSAYSGIFDTGRDDFRVTTMAEMMEAMEVVTGALTWLLLAIVAISLLVGGVGIMNIMYVVVGERTSEIGLRKAVGATYKTIMMQFLIEAVVITLAGGVVGIIFGTVISYIIAVGASYSGLNWVFSIPLKAFIVALSFSAFFGLLFGIYPARKAALMEPINALRKE